MLQETRSKKPSAGCLEERFTLLLLGFVRVFNLSSYVALNIFEFVFYWISSFTSPTWIWFSVLMIWFFLKLNCYFNDSPWVLKIWLNHQVKSSWWPFLVSSQNSSPAVRRLRPNLQGKEKDPASHWSRLAGAGSKKRLRVLFLRMKSLKWANNNKWCKMVIF